MGWFKKLFGFSTPEFIKDVGQHIGSWAPQTVGTVLTAMGMPQFGIPIAAAGSGVHAYQSDKSLGNVLGSAVKGGATAYLGGSAVKGFTTPGVTGANASILNPTLMERFAGAGGNVLNALLPGADLGTNVLSNFNLNTGLKTGQGLGQATSMMPSTNLGGWTINPATGQVIPGVGDQVGMPSATSAQGGLLEKLFGKGIGGKTDWGKIGLGMGIAGMGNMMVGTPEMPQSQDINTLRQSLLSGGGMTEVGKLAQSQLTQGLQTQYTGLPEDYRQSLTRDMDEQLTMARKNLMQQYKSIRPGADIENDSAFRKDMQDLERKFALAKTDMLAQAEYQDRLNFTAQKFQEIQLATGLDQETIAQYAKLAQLDLTQLMMQYGIDYQVAKDLKSVFGDLGSMLMQSGVGLNQGNTMNLFSLGQ